MEKNVPTIADSAFIDEGSNPIKLHATKSIVIITRNQAFPINFCHPNLQHKIPAIKNGSI